MDNVLALHLGHGVGPMALNLHEAELFTCPVLRLQLFDLVEIRWLRNPREPAEYYQGDFSELYSRSDAFLGQLALELIENQ